MAASEVISGPTEIMQAAGAACPFHAVKRLGGAAFIAASRASSAFQHTLQLSLEHLSRSRMDHLCLVGREQPPRKFAGRQGEPSQRKSRRSLRCFGVRIPLLGSAQSWCEHRSDRIDTSTLPTVRRPAGTQPSRQVLPEVASSTPPSSAESLRSRSSTLAWLSIQAANVHGNPIMRQDRGLTPDEGA